MLYGCQIWGQNENAKLFKNVEKLQKRAMRIMSFSRYDAPSGPLFQTIQNPQTQRPNYSIQLSPNT